MIFFFHLWYDFQSFFAVFQTIYRYFHLYKQQVDLTISLNARLISDYFVWKTLIRQTICTKVRQYFTFSFFNLFLCYSCARIDNNRREYCAHRAAQLCVHACVLRFFFFFLITSLVMQLNSSHNHYLKAFVRTLCCFLVMIACGRARIDNNRREYFVPRAAQLCELFVCAPFFFLFFI